MKIEISTLVDAEIDAVWEAWITPEDICRWNAASEDWHTTAAELALAPGSGFSYTMEAKDGSAGFDFAGTYTVVEPQTRIDFELEDNRAVSTTFEVEENGVRVRQCFEAENELSAKQQKDGWQAILNNFSQHVEAKHRK